ncbi:MAG TPA: F0F1 ATP synthase subunit B [Planctomycetota bacterium]
MATILGTATLFASEGEGLDGMFTVGTGSFLWTLLIFGLALLPLWKVVFGPITKALDDRELATREAARAAERAREEIESMKAGIQLELDQARREAAQAVADARTRAEAREKQILAEARAQAEKDRQRAQEEIARSLVAAREQLRSEAVILGMDVAQKVLGRQFAPEDQQRLVQSFEGDLAAGR